ncbi:F-box domain-containing protein [Entamoeba marina]
MSRLQPIYIMNVILYLDLEYVPILLMVSKSCKVSIDSMRINPWNYYNNKRAHRIVMKVMELFPKLETLQIDSLSLQFVNKFLINSISMIRLCNHDLTSRAQQINDKLTTSSSLNSFNAQKLFIGYYDFKVFLKNFNSYKNVKYIKVTGCQGEEIDLQDINTLCNDYDSKKNNLRITLCFRVVTQTEYDYVSSIIDALPLNVSIIFMDSINVGFEHVLVRNQPVRYLHNALTTNMDMAQKYYLPFNLNISNNQKTYDLTKFTYLENVSFLVSSDFNVSLPLSIKNMLVVGDVNATITNKQQLFKFHVYTNSLEYENALYRNRDKFDDGNELEDDSSIEILRPKKEVTSKCYS